MSLTAQMAAEANADHNRPLLFIRIDYGYPNDPMLAVTCPFALTITGTGDSNMDNETFQALDGISISGFKQDTNGSIQELTLALALKDSNPFIELLDEDLWWNSPAKVWFGYFMADFTQVVFAPSLRISGILDKLTVTVDKNIGVATAVIRSNRLLLDRQRGSRYVASQHQTRYPTDRAFSFLPRLASGELLLANDKPAQPYRPPDYSNYDYR